MWYKIHYLFPVSSKHILLLEEKNSQQALDFRLKEIFQV